MNVERVIGGDASAWRTDSSGAKRKEYATPPVRRLRQNRTNVPIEELASGMLTKKATNSATSTAAST